MKYWTTLLIAGAGLLGGCAATNPTNERLTEVSVTSPVVASKDQVSGSIQAKSQEFTPRSVDSTFSKSEFIANDFLNVVTRIRDFSPGVTRFSASLPRTRYGEILMEKLREAEFAIVLGPSDDLPRLNYHIELPQESNTGFHTFFVSLGDIHLKRSYEIVGEQIAPVTEMLMAGISPNSLRQKGSSDVSVSVSSDSESGLTQVRGTTDISSNYRDSLGPGIKVPDLNRLVSESDDWNPLTPNMYESRTSVYEPLFDDATVDYSQVNSQVLIFPNDSLVLDDGNKQFLSDLATNFKSSTDIVRVIGCSHGRTNLIDGNQNLARGRAVRVREELILSGVDTDSILHEACWANVHFDEMMPRRGVVVMHLRQTPLN